MVVDELVLELEVVPELVEDFEVDVDNVLLVLELLLLEELVVGSGSPYPPGVVTAAQRAVVLNAKRARRALNIRQHIICKSVCEAVP